MVVLQAATPAIVPLQAGLFFLATDYVTVALGLAISYLAYRGYRRNGSRPMLFVAAGFVLVMGVPGLLGVAYFVVPGLDQVTVGTLTQVSEMLGMASILYGLWVEP